MLSKPTNCLFTSSTFAHVKSKCSCVIKLLNLANARVALRTTIYINQVRTQAESEALVCHWDLKGLHIVKHSACDMTGLLRVGNLEWRDMNLWRYNI